MTQPLVISKQEQPVSAAPDNYQVAMAEFVKKHKSSDGNMNALQQTVCKHPALLNGKYYQRSISVSGAQFLYPDLADHYLYWIFAWSRICGDQEYLCAVNLDQQISASLYVTIDSNLHPVGNKMNCLFGTGDIPNELNVEVRNGKAVRLTIPAGGMVCYVGGLV